SHIRTLRYLPTRRSSDLPQMVRVKSPDSNAGQRTVRRGVPTKTARIPAKATARAGIEAPHVRPLGNPRFRRPRKALLYRRVPSRSEEHTSELQSRFDLVC